MSAEDQRTENRLLCAGLIEVHWTGEGGCPAATVANLNDLSPGGVSLWLDCCLPPGTRLEFFQSGQRAVGSVRYCHRAEFGWIAGVRFDPDSEWDPVAFPPEHLVDPRSIPPTAKLDRGRMILPAGRGSIEILLLDGAVKRGGR